jgi:SpoIID/LytB domain protein
MLAAFTAVALLPFASPGASAASNFTFYGSGYGHGIGMSQWGAYGLAQMGWTHQRILTHFYQGTAVERRATLPRSIRVGLTDGRTVIHLTAQAGPVEIWEGKPGKGTLVGAIPKGATWTVTAKAAGAYAVRDGTGALVGGRWGGPGTNLIVRYESAGARVFVPEADAIWGRGFSYGRGTLEFNLYSCGDADGCAERLIARLSLEDYLYGLGEVPASWPMEALEAQAVAARSFAAYAIRHGGRRASCNCHLTDGAGDQTYMGYERESGASGDRWVSAVDQTRRQVVTYSGNVIQAFYAASDGGHSENVEDAWHGGNPAYAIPWLTGVCDPGESTPANPWDAWQRSFDASTLTSRLIPYTGSIGTITGFTSIVRGDSGRVVTLVAQGSSGAKKLSGTQLRAGLGLPDDRVWINSDRTIRGAIREKYDGLMCRPGLPTAPQRVVSDGAQQFFQTGGVYLNAGTGLTVWLKGSIDREYRGVGAVAGTLGVPVTPPRSLSGTRALSCTTCRRADFAQGRIYWKGGTGAHALWGPVLSAYLANGGAQGALGFPTTRVKNRSDGGTRALFEHGRIVCAAGEACTVATV